MKITNVEYFHLNPDLCDRYKGHEVRLAGIDLAEDGLDLVEHRVLIWVFVLPVALAGTSSSPSSDSSSGHLTSHPFFLHFSSFFFHCKTSHRLSN